MRTTIDIPDALFRHLKARAALEGSSLRDLVVDLVSKGLQVPAIEEAAAAALPSIKLGAPMALSSADLSNANLSGYLDE
jgi:plasmid stability protein